MVRQDRRKTRVRQMKKEGKSVHGKNANSAKSTGEKTFNKLKEI
jgi:hypothetical protein